MGIYIYKSRSKEEKDLVVEFVAAEAVSSSKFESETSPAKYHVKSPRARPPVHNGFKQHHRFSTIDNSPQAK